MNDRAAWSGEDVPDDLKRMADAAGQIDQRRKAYNDEVAAAVVWLNAKREEIGLVALANLSEVDAASLI